MLGIQQVEEIERHLTSLPPLIDQLEAKSPGFHNQARSWLRDLEELLTRHNLSQAADVALLRAELTIAPLRDRLESSAARSLKGKRSRQLAVAGNALERAGEIVGALLEEPRGLFTEATRVARQIAAVAQVKGLRLNGTSWGDALVAWKQISTDSDLLSPATHLVGLVGRNNAIILFMKVQADV